MAATVTEQQALSQNGRALWRAENRPAAVSPARALPFPRPNDLSRVRRLSGPAVSHQRDGFDSVPTRISFSKVVDCRRDLMTGFGIIYITNESVV